MCLRAKFLLTAAVLVLLVTPLVCRAQTSEASLESFVSQSVGEAEKVDSATIGEWTIRHPGETVEAPAERGRDYDPENARDMHDRELEGRWCLRSTAEIPLTGGISVHRIALFYQPLVEQIYDKPLPPLPTETGDALRQHGCRIGKILYEFDGVTDQQIFAETLAKLIPGKRSEEPGNFIVDYQGKDYWRPVYSFDNIVSHGFIYDLYVSKPIGSRPGEQPAVLLDWKGGILEYGQPSSKTINPEAGQPWLAIRAAMLARLPESPTLAMLSFLAPQVGDRYEQPPFYCEKQLIPVLSEWMDLAARSAPEQHAAALLLADRVAGRLSDCDVFSDSSDYVPPNAEGAEEDSDVTLRNKLKKLGIETDKSARPGPEYYARNLLRQVLKLAPKGPVNELYWMALLNDRCQWSETVDSDCTNFIKEGESFLMRFPEDEWTSSVHLILAEAYAITAANLGQDYSATPDTNKINLEKKATAHYRAWYAKSVNERDRALVWEEIWALDAGMGPWLNLPWEFQQ